MFNVPTLTAGVFAAGMFLAPIQASAAQIGVGAVPETATAVHEVQYGYGGPRFGYGHRATAVRTSVAGATVMAVAMDTRYGYGRGYGRGYGYGRPGIF